MLPLRKPQKEVIKMRKEKVEELFDILNDMPTLRINSPRIKPKYPIAILCPRLYVDDLNQTMTFDLHIYQKKKPRWLSGWTVEEIDNKKIYHRIIMISY